MNFSNFDSAKPCDLNTNDQFVPSNAYSIESACNEPSSTSTSTTHHIKKNVSFNKDIDVRIFRKNSKNLTKIVDSFMLPLTQSSTEIINQINNDQNNDQVVHENITLLKKKSGNFID